METVVFWTWGRMRNMDFYSAPLVILSQALIGVFEDTGSVMWTWPCLPKRAP